MKDKINLKNLLALVCCHYDVTPSYVFLKTRSKDIVNIRYLFFYLAIKHCDVTREKLGEFSVLYVFKKFDHATTTHAKKKITNLLKANDKEIVKHHNELEDLIAKIKPQIGMIHSIVNYHNEIKELKEELKEANTGKVVTKYDVFKRIWVNSEKDNVLETYNKLDQERKEKAILQLETSLKIQENMQHQKLRVS